METIAILLAFAIVSRCGSMKINCNFEPRNWNYIADVTYTCYGTAVFDGKLNFVEAIEGAHRQGKTNLNVDAFQVYNQRISSIPKNLASFFPRIMVLMFSSSDVSLVSSADFEPFPELTYIDFNKNKIVSLPGDLFAYNPKLKFINFGTNKLQHIGHNLLGNLKQLQAAHFSNNPCISKYTNSASEISELNSKLSIACPPAVVIATTTKVPDMCSITCAEVEEITLKLQDEDQQFTALSKKIDEIERKLNEIKNLL